MFDLFVLLSEIAIFFGLVLLCIPLSAFGIWIYEKLTGKVLPLEQDDWDDGWDE